MKDNNPLVSIIIPIYNVEGYLIECVDSVITQTYSNIEIVLVDDCSLDKSGAIADELSKKDQRIKVIHKKRNEGLNMARATGFSGSSGDLITFLDSDDLLINTFVGTGVEALIKHKADFVRFGSLNFKSKKDLSDRLQSTSLIQETVITKKKDLFDISVGRGLITVWGAIYTRNVINRIDWKETNYRVYEDNIWTLRLLENINKAIYITNLGYLYRSDDTITNVLSKRITGNSYNGKPVGYLEFIHILTDEYNRFNQKFNLKSDDTIKLAVDWHWSHRLNNIDKVQNWVPEKNDEKYIINLLVWVAEIKKGLEQENLSKQAHIERLEDLLADKNTEIASFLKVRRSIRLVVGNIKRRIKSIRG